MCGARRFTALGVSYLLRPAALAVRGFRKAHRVPGLSGFMVPVSW